MSEGSDKKRSSGEQATYLAAMLLLWVATAGVIHLTFVYVAPMAEGQEPPAFWENLALVAICWAGLAWWRRRKARKREASSPK